MRKRGILMDDKEKNKQNLDYVPYDFQGEDRVFNNILKIIMGLCLSTLICCIGGKNGMFTIGSFLTTASLVTPLTYIVATKLKNRSDRIFERDMYQSQMFGYYLKEGLSKDHTIEKESTFFFKEIGEYNFNIDIDNMENLNQFLFLINQNYYEEIVNAGVDVSRRELIIKVLDQVNLYFNIKFPNKEVIFDYSDAEEVMRGCFFLPDKIKESILAEFASSRVAGTKPCFIIKPKKEFMRESLTEEYLESKEYLIKSFDIEDISYYEMLKRVYAKVNNNEFKDATNLEWDLETIRQVMSLIVRRFGIILEKRQDGPYHFEMTSTFFYHLCAYASLNKATKVGIEEIINTLKNFDYFDFEMRKDIIDAIFEEFNLDYSMHPYRSKKKKDTTGKVYSFPTYSEKE